MASRMDSIYERYVAGCTKSRTKILQQENGEKEKTYPEKPEKGKTGCVLGAGGDEDG